MNLRTLLSVKVLLPVAFVLAMVASCAHNDDVIYTTNSNDSLKLADYHEQALGSDNLEEAVEFANKELELARKLHSDSNEVKALLVLYKIYYDHGRNTESLSYASQASKLADSIGIRSLSAECYHALGNALSRFKNNPIAAKNFAQSFLIYFKMNDSASVVNVWRDLVPAYVNANIFDSAMMLCGRCIGFDSRKRNERGLAESIAQLGSTHLAIFRSNVVDPEYTQLDSAYIYLRQAEAINRKYNDPKIRKILCMGLMETLYNLSVQAKDPKRRRELADSSMLYLPEACIVANNTGVAEVIHRINIIGVKVHYAVGDMKATKRFVDSLVLVAHKTNSYIDKETAFRAQSLYSAYNNNFDSAFAYRVLAEKNREVINYSDNSFLLSIKLAQGQMEGERDAAVHREDALRNETQRQRTIIMTSIVSIVLMSVIGVLLIFSVRRARRLNDRIQSINEEMRVQSEEIRLKNDEIMDGISYASIIQFAAMPSAAEMKHMFGDNLVYISARNVVSGDFYWASEDASGRYKLLAVGDCTGHGVPGALLSMLGMSILDYTTRHFGAGEISAGIVLDKMRNNFKRTLNQTSFRSDQTVDSIDIALLVFDTQDRTLHYSAAFRPLLMFRYGELMRMKGDSMPIGIYLRESPHFTDNVMKLCKGDIIYLYTDGITDQAGYEDATAKTPRAYSTKLFFKLLKNIFKQPFDEQESAISHALDEWRQPKISTQVECDKTDDATIVGVAVNNFINFDEVSNV